MGHKKLIVICLIALFPLAVILSNCRPAATKIDARGPAYAGMATCISCHKDIYASYTHTAHFFTSLPATLNNIHGSFKAGESSFSFGNGMRLIVQRRDSGLYQAGYVNGRLTGARRLDIAIGGVKAETYLSWQGRQVFELPLSWFGSVHGWTNSPGYQPDHINFNRSVVIRCFECHSSYVSQLPVQSLLNRKTEYERNTLIYGIDCERCHGPGADHVAFHQANPDEKKPHYIATFKSLTRAQKLDACAVCHGGNNERFEVSAFDFKPGDTLSKFKEPQLFSNPVNVAEIDVHGNQSALLAASKCFLMSNMDCTTCHDDVHINTRGNTMAYTQKCLNCHNAVNHNQCKMKAVPGAALKAECIDCHMPAQASNVIAVQTATQKKAMPYMVRTHRIAIYPAEAKKIRAFIQNLH